MVKVINIDTKTKTIHISNADGDIKTWRTTESGTHFPIREGESTKEALDKFVGSKRPETKKGQQPADTPQPGITWNLTEKQKKEFKDAYEKQDKARTKEDEEIDDLCYNYGVDDEKDLMKAIEDHYVNQVAFYGKDSRDAEQAMRDYRKVGKYLGQEPKSHDELMQGRTIEFEPDLPAESETADWPKSPKFEKLTEQYMPKQGEADNQLGEMLRSINRVVYRYYNDGDMWNKGYGKETVNQAIKHLTELAKNKETPRHIARGLDNALYELKKYGTKDKDRYETALKIMMQTVEWADQSDIDALSKMKAGKKEPAKSEPTGKPMSADHVKQTMQKTMESFPKLYSWEKPHLEKFADDIWSELEKNPGKEQEILDEWVEAYDDAAKRLGMWVDTPTLVKRDFVKKVAESWKNNSGTQGQQPEKTASAPEKSESTGDVSGSYPELGGVQQALWDAGYIMDNYDDGEFGDSGTEYVWKDGTMYAVDITKNPDGSVSAKQSSMGEVSQSEYAKYLDEIHADDDDDEEEDDEEDSDISGIESRGEAANWLNAMTRKHGNTYFWSGNMKSALNKLVEKFGNTYFWNK